MIDREQSTTGTAHVEQLSAQDASFLYVENEKVANHVGGLYVYDQSAVPGGDLTFKGILRYLESKLHLVPRYRQRLVEVPGNIDHPYWVDDPNFDLEYHVRHMALPKPGDWRQLCIQTSRIYDRPLDMDRPLWVFYVIEGLDHVERCPPGSFAIVTKTHHAMIDGVSGTAMATALHDLDPNSEIAEPQPWTAERQPQPMELVQRTVVKNLSQPMNFFRLMAETAPVTARVMTGLQDGSLKLPVAAGDVPRTRFNGNTSRHKVIDAVSLPLADLKSIKNVVPGATINDAILAIGGGALRKYLLDKGELPDKPLITLAPISVRSDNPADAANGGNAVSGMLVPLGTHIEDPLERLATVHEAAVDSKKLTNAVGAKVMTDFTQFIPGVTMGMASRLSSALGLATAGDPIINTVLTNVPGPQVPLYFCGARLVDQFSLGIVQDGMCLFQGILSYDGRLTLTAMSDREAMPDPEFYRNCLLAAFEELRDAAAEHIAA
jgi:diacylglycerol O-acyltransferase